MSYFDCWFFKGKVVLLIISFNNSYRVVSSKGCWHITMETYSIGLVLAIWNSATYSDARLSSSATRVLNFWLLVVLRQENHLLIHIERSQTYRSVCEMLNFCLVSCNSNIHKSRYFSRLYLTRSHRIVVKWLRMKVKQCRLLLIYSWFRSKTGHIIALSSTSYSMMMFLLS